MPEDIVEDVRLLQVIQLLGLANETPGHEAAIGEMLEKHRVGHQSRHRHHAPAGQSVQAFRQILEVGNASARQAEALNAFQESGAGPVLQHADLAGIQAGPRPGARFAE